MRVGLFLKERILRAEEIVYTKNQRQETVWCERSIVSIPRLIKSGSTNSYPAPGTPSGRHSNLD